MACIFSLSAECGQDKREAEAIAKHFDGYVAVLDDGSEYQCSSDVSNLDGAWWAICCPNGVSRTGIGSKDDERILTAVGFALYERRKSSPPFRFAIVGVEVEGFREYDDIDRNVIELGFSGLVLADAIWQRLDMPDMFVPFTPDYRWRPFARAR